jgi:two-component system, response regulator YesN
MTLLLVDDDQISIDILADYIKPHLPYFDEVVCAYEASQAFDIILSTRPRIIVTDIIMPNISGIELIKKVQSIENYSPNVIIISGHRDFDYARDALKLNVVDYILKPIDPEELIEKIQLCLKPLDYQATHNRDDIGEEVQKYISNRLHMSLKLGNIAEYFHYNAAYLGRLIKKKTGLNFNEYIMKLRMIKAQSLLVNTNYYINRISEEIGFKDPENFAKRFRKSTGYTPTRFREKYQTKTDFSAVIDTKV